MSTTSTSPTTAEPRPHSPLSPLSSGSPAPGPASDPADADADDEDSGGASVEDRAAAAAAEDSSSDEYESDDSEDVALVVLNNIDRKIKMRERQDDFLKGPLTYDVRKMDRLPLCQSLQITMKPLLKRSPHPPPSGVVICGHSSGQEVRRRTPREGAVSPEDLGADQEPPLHQPVLARLDTPDAHPPSAPVASHGHGCWR